MDGKRGGDRKGKGERSERDGKEIKGWEKEWEKNGKGDWENDWKKDWEKDWKVHEGKRKGKEKRKEERRAAKGQSLRGKGENDKQGERDEI